jgi:hypothetical protein
MHRRDELLRIAFEQIPEALDDWRSVPLEVTDLADGPGALYRSL